jgi:C-terminal processing protease CtpA/Prc
MKEMVLKKSALCTALLLSLAACGGGSESTKLIQSAPVLAGPPIVSGSVVSFSDVRANYTVLRVGKDLVVTDKLGKEGVFTVPSGVDVLKFSDVSISLSVVGDAKNISTAELESIIELYIAFFNRVPDADGLNYWIGRYRAGMTLTQIGQSFLDAALIYPVETGYSKDMSNTAFINIVYKNVLGRIPDADGFNYWMSRLTSVGKVVTVQEMLQAAHGSSTNPTYGWVSTYLDNKIYVGRHFAVEQGITPLVQPVSKGMAIAAAVTKTDVTAAMSLMDDILGYKPLPAPATYQNLCAAPRPGTADKAGSLSDEKNYLASFVDDTYLWYRDVPRINAASYATPEAYFDVLKTSALTKSNKDVDEFHWSVTQAEYDNQNSGISEGYGIKWATAKSSPPRDWVVSNIEPTGPAWLFRRGDKLKSVDGEDFVNGNRVDIINEGLFPTKVAPHTFEVIRNGLVLSFTVTPKTYETTPVRNASVVDTPSGKVGYIYFDSHIRKSEAMLVDAFNTVKNQGAKDLVLDLRYNGGGLIYIASQVAYMVAGDKSNDKVFDHLVYNDKKRDWNDAYPFYNITTTNQFLPTLNLKRVYVLTGSGTASASEAIINGLRGIDVEVILIGSTTRGKPYGFVPQSNCGSVYYTVQFKGENNKGFGDFADGFPATCVVKDDYTKALGDPLEAQFATALSYRQSATCPAPSGSIRGLSPLAEPNYQVTPNPSTFLAIPGKLPRK